MRALFLFLARQESFKNFIMRFRFFRNTAWRFVAGETLDDAVGAVRELNRQKIRGTLDFLGENTLSRSDAENASQEVLTMLDRIRSELIDCNVSVKLTQLGLALDKEFCYANMLRIVSHARTLGNFVRVDMEDSPFTQSTLDLVLRARKEEGDHVGAVIQAYLYRSGKDVETLIAEGCRVRLCKGAYLEPDTVAFKKKDDTDANFVKLMQMLLSSGIYHAIATHDPAMVRATTEFAAARGIPKERFEFQMLYGIRRDLQQSLAAHGHNVRTYVPYGRRWYPYYMRRLAERPANVLFIARNLFKD